MFKHIGILSSLFWTISPIAAQPPLVWIGHALGQSCACQLGISHQYYHPGIFFCLPLFYVGSTTFFCPVLSSFSASGNFVRKEYMGRKTFETLNIWWKSLWLFGWTLNSSLKIIFPQNSYAFTVILQYLSVSACRTSFSQFSESS